MGKFKSTYKFEFPRKKLTHTAECNPMHIEAVTALVMSEHDADLCMVYSGDTLWLICVYIKGEGFKCFYKDTSKRTELYLVHGCDRLIEVADADDLAEETADIDSGTYKCIQDSTTFTHRDFYTQEQADAYAQGVDHAMCLTGSEDEYRFVSEQRYYELKNWLEQ